MTEGYINKVKSSKNRFYFVLFTLQIALKNKVFCISILYASLQLECAPHLRPRIMFSADYVIHLC